MRSLGIGKEGPRRRGGIAIGGLKGTEGTKRGKRITGRSIWVLGSLAEGVGLVRGRRTKEEEEEEM